MKYYEDAGRMSYNDLGEHDLTLTCYQSLGDYFFQLKEYENSVEKYTIAKEIFENFKITSIKYVLLLNNLGRCLTYVNREGGIHYSSK